MRGVCKYLVNECVCVCLPVCVLVCVCVFFVSYEVAASDSFDEERTRRMHE